MKKLTIPEAIILHLIDNRGQWIMGASLEKVTLHGKWTGVSATRRMREICEDGYYVMNGTKYFVERKTEKGLTYFRVTSGARFEQKTQFIEQPNGTVLAKISTQLVTV